MNERVRRLRERSLQTEPTISSERARLVTEFYSGPGARGVSAVMQRAMAFKYIMENKEICINDDELIVGERGPSPKATPTYPEVTCHTISDLETLNSRPKTSFRVTEETKKIYSESVIPFWRGRSMRDRIFSEMTQEWKDAYDAGVFTEFMEQRAPGHTVNGGTIYHKGMLSLKEDISRAIAGLDYYNDPEAFSKKEQLCAMSICADAIITFARRHSDLARRMSANEKNPQRQAELLRIAKICRRVPADAPRDFYEALQAYWFIHLGVITEYNTWDAFNPGRLDQHLWPFYKKGLEENSLTREGAKDLLQAFWVKFNNQPSPPKVGVTAEESGTYTDFALINVGGLKRDGSDGVNELSFLILDVIEEMRILQPSSMVQISARTPDSFLIRALRIVRTGFGQPSIFNSDAIVKELVRQGKIVQDAREGGASGCVEAGAFGREAYILTGYFNLPKIFEITLHNGFDPRTGKKIGLQTGTPESFDTFDKLFAAYKRQIQYFVDIKIRGSNVIERLYMDNLPAPFLSILIDDCIARGKDYHAGGARYNTNYIQGVGTGTITDSLSSINYNVFERNRLSLKSLASILDRNYDNEEILRNIFLNKTPKYGNDDDFADSLMQRVFEAYFDAVDGRPSPRGGKYRINMLPTTAHIYFGKVLGATPDGRKAEEPISEGVSPVQGADRHGPTAVIKSVGKMDHIRTGGTLLNQKFTPQLLNDEDDLVKLAHLVRSYFRLDGHHIQFNVVSADLLKEAQVHPEKHRDLIVRVAGYSDYFVDCGTELQDEIIRRTEHQAL